MAYTPIKTLETKKKHEARKKRNQTIIGIFIAIVMVSSIAGFAMLQGNIEEQGQEEYQGRVFIKTDTGWQTQINILGKFMTLNTLYLPQELENITTQGKAFLDDFRGKTIYLVADDYNERQAASTFWNALNSLALRIQLACLEEGANKSFCKDNNLPIKNCDNANPQTSIIIIKETETKPDTNINFKNSCLLVEGKENELVRAAEKSIFMILGIIE